MCYFTFLIPVRSLEHNSQPMCLLSSPYSQPTIKRDLKSCPFHRLSLVPPFLKGHPTKQRLQMMWSPIQEFCACCTVYNCPKLLTAHLTIKVLLHPEKSEANIFGVNHGKRLWIDIIVSSLKKTGLTLPYRWHRAQTETEIVPKIH